MKEKYAGMIGEEKDIVLRRNRAYKMGTRHTLPSSDQSDIAQAASGSAIPSSSTSTIYRQPFGQCTRSGGMDNDEDSDVAALFEPTEPTVEVDETLHDIQDQQPMYAVDEECGIFSGQGDLYHECICPYAARIIPRRPTASRRSNQILPPLSLARWPTPVQSSSFASRRPNSSVSSPLPVLLCCPRTPVCLCCHTEVHERGRSSSTY